MREWNEPTLALQPEAADGAASHFLSLLVVSVKLGLNEMNTRKLCLFFTRLWRPRKPGKGTPG